MITRGLACGNTSFYVAGTGSCASDVVSADWRDANLQIRVTCFREQQVRWILTRMSNQHRLGGHQEVRCLSNMPGEERFRVLQLEPTR